MAWRAVSTSHTNIGGVCNGHSAEDHKSTQTMDK
jgi:hypothetical protein